jgi:hypothetical protein
MQDSVRKQRLTREALGTTEVEMLDAGRTLLAIGKILFVGLAVTALLGYRHDGHEIVAVSAINAHAASGQRSPETGDPRVSIAQSGSDGQEQRRGEASRNEPEGNVVDLTY